MVYLHKGTHTIQLLKNKDIMKLAGKWIKLENIILSEITQTQKDTHVDISHKVQDNYVTIHRPKEGK